jgi:hypothetical protein
VFTGVTGFVEFLGFGEGGMADRRGSGSRRMRRIAEFFRRFSVRQYLECAEAHRLAEKTGLLNFLVAFVFVTRLNSQKVT